MAFRTVQSRAPLTKVLTNLKFLSALGALILIDGHSILLTSLSLAPQGGAGSRLIAVLASVLDF